MFSDDKAAIPDERLGNLAFLARTLSDENRLRIIIHLANGRKSVAQIVEDLNLSQPLVSHHLRELKRSLLVEVERRGPFMLYALSCPEILDLLEMMNGLAGNLISSRKSF